MCVVVSQVLVRPAQADDKDAVFAFCQNTFSWGDYIPDSWDRWLNDTVGGRMLVGVVDNKPVALMHVAFLHDGVAWMEGMRVHPDYRRRGLGSAIDAAACRFACEHGCHLARLVTSVKNLAAQTLLERDGYTRVAQYNEWQSKPARKKFSHARIVMPHQSPALHARLKSKQQSACTVLPDRHWHWETLTEPRLRERIDAGEVRSLDDGWAILLAFEESDWNGLSLYALCGDEKTMRELASAARGEARYRGFAHSEAFLVDDPTINAAIVSAGYTHQGGVFLYEQILK